MTESAEHPSSILVCCWIRTRAGGEGRDIAQAVKHSAVTVWVLLYGGSIFCLGYFPFQPVVHNWSVKGLYVLSSLWDSAYK